jgi:hypothetical protein
VTELRIVQNGRDAEIADFEDTPLISHENIARLQIPVHDIQLMQKLQPRQNALEPIPEEKISYYH